MPVSSLFFATAIAAVFGVEPPSSTSASANPSSAEAAPSERSASAPIEPVLTSARAAVPAPTSEVVQPVVAPEGESIPAGAEVARPTPSAESTSERVVESAPERSEFLEPKARAPSRRQLRGKAPISVRLKTLGELGAVNVVSHKLQLGKSGTNFDLRRDGRQDTMFLFGRLSAELEVDDHHQIILLYQPINLRTETVLMDELVADDVTFPAMTGLEIFYGFDIYRLSYAYDFLTDPEQELALGFSMQVRNFRSSYLATDGEQSVSNTNIGPVPVIKVRGRHQLSRANFWYGGEVDAFYANIPFINGGDDPVEGLIVDASLRAGVTIGELIKPYANLRYIGGGGKGTSSDKVGFGDGYSSNWLHTIAFTLGAELTLPAVIGDRPRRDREVAARKARRKARRGG